MLLTGRKQRFYERLEGNLWVDVDASITQKGIIYVYVKTVTQSFYLERSKKSQRIYYALLLLLILYGRVCVSV